VGLLPRPRANTGMASVSRPMTHGGWRPGVRDRVSVGLGGLSARANPGWSPGKRAAGLAVGHYWAGWSALRRERKAKGGDRRVGRLGIWAQE
jgi:hypothetical protein